MWKVIKLQYIDQWYWRFSINTGLKSSMNLMDQSKCRFIYYSFESFSSFFNRFNIFTKCKSDKLLILRLKTEKTWTGNHDNMILIGHLIAESKISVIWRLLCLSFKLKVFLLDLDIGYICKDKVSWFRNHNFNIIFAICQRL